MLGKLGRGLLIGFAIFVAGIGVLLVLAVRRPPAHASDARAPLTDVAGAAPIVSISPSEAPSRRVAPAEVDSAATKVVLPTEMRDVVHPPQWTRPRAVPGTPKPPDPSIPPPMTVDPERGHHPDTE